MQQMFDLTGQGLAGFCIFQQMIALGKGNVSASKQPGLPDDEVAQVVEILGRKGGCIDLFEARVTTFDHVLLNQDDHATHFGDIYLFSQMSASQIL
jgi:hypothetical protein